MRLTVRTFLFSFLPIVFLLAGSFWAVQRTVESAVHDGVRSMLRNHQMTVARMQARTEQQSRRYLRILGENAALNAGLRLMIDYPDSAAARLTVEDQLRDLASAAGIDLLVIASTRGEPIVGVVAVAGGVAAVEPGAIGAVNRGLVVHDGSKYQVTSVPLKHSEETVALVCVGERLEFENLATPVVLLRANRVIESNLEGVPTADMERAMAGCRPEGECELRLPGSVYLSLATSFGDGYTLRTLMDLGGALHPVQAVIRNLFLLTGATALGAAVFVTMLSAWSIVKPIARVIEHLRKSEADGKLRAFDATAGAVEEVRELMLAFNRTATAMHAAEQSLHRAYVEFVGSLASALDARDRYTAGHSTRVAAYSCAIAERLKLAPEDVARIRIGALLHDIGKIGIPDCILQKPSGLTDDEFRRIQEHAGIGRRILEGVNGFATYLPAVELHHENWDGTGYPHGLSGRDVPVDARIIHVADAYDAMTSDRPYRRGMTPETAIERLREHAGSQFDPEVVEAFIQTAPAAMGDGAESLRRLAARVSAERGAHAIRLHGPTRA